MTEIDQLLDRLRAKAELSLEVMDLIPPNAREGVEQNVADDQDAIRTIEIMRRKIEDLEDYIEDLKAGLQ